MEKTINYKLRYKVWKYIDIAISLIPLIIYGAIHFDKYFGVKRTALSNAVGLGTLVFVLVIVMLKKTELLKGLLGLVLAELILIFLDVYVQDLKFILGMGIIGLFISSLITKPFVIKYKRLYDKKETAEENATALNKGLDRLVEAISGKGSGRA